MTNIRKIEVVNYNSAWPDEYLRAEESLRKAFDPAVLKIEHIGSTSIPGLSAKPTIDILVIVKSGTDIPSFDKHMENEGYTCRGECLDAEIPGTPGRFYYVRKRGVDHLTHVHACAEDHSQISEYLAFRDYLRIHPSRAMSYGREKVRLSIQYSHDNIGYMKGKDPLVKQLIQEAKVWACERH